MSRCHRREAKKLLRAQLCRFVIQKAFKRSHEKTLAEKTAEFINACKTKDELRAWELMAKNNPDLMEIYNAKLKSL